MTICRKSIKDYITFVVSVALLFWVATVIISGVHYGSLMFPQWLLKIVSGLIIGSFLYDYFTGFKVNHYASYALISIFCFGFILMTSLIENTIYEPYFREVATLNFYDLPAYAKEKILENSSKVDWITPLVASLMLFVVSGLLPFKIGQYLVCNNKTNAV